MTESRVEDTFTKRKRSWFVGKTCAIRYHFKSGKDRFSGIMIRLSIALAQWIELQLARPREVLAETRRDDIGGIVSNIRGIGEHSTHYVSVFPSPWVKRFLRTQESRNNYDKGFSVSDLRKFRILHSHASDSFINLCAEARNGKTKWVHTYHAYYFESDWENGLTDWQKRLNHSLINVASQADVRLCAARWLQDYYRGEHGIETIHIPEAIDVKECEQGCARRFGERFGVDGFALYVGYDRAVKNPDMFVDLARRCSEMPCVMIGWGLTREFFAKRSGQEKPNNLWMFGPQPFSDVLDAMAACRVLVMTSKHDTFPHVQLEAMAQGKVVVAPRHTGCREALEDGKFGYNYEPDDFDDLLDKVSAALSDSLIGEKARAHVIRNYDWQVVGRKIDAIYADLL